MSMHISRDISRRALNLHFERIRGEAAACPKCQNPAPVERSKGALRQCCPFCGWEGPPVSPLGISAVEEDYE